jgi:Domain of unknown function (DUF4337)
LEAEDVKELQERAERGAKEGKHRPVAFSMSLMAVLVAVTTVLGHRSHTEAVLYQNKATDQWNEYQAKKIRANNTALISDLLSVVTISDKDAADRITKAYADHQKKWNDDLKGDSEKAQALEERVERAEARAVRFDLAEALLEIGLVITSVTLLTHRFVYWYFGMVFSAAGLISAASAFFLH